MQATPRPSVRPVHREDRPDCFGLLLEAGGRPPLYMDLVLLRPPGIPSLIFEIAAAGRADLGVCPFDPSGDAEVRSAPLDPLGASDWCLSVRPCVDNWAAVAGPGDLLIRVVARRSRPSARGQNQAEG